MSGFNGIFGMFEIFGIMFFVVWFLIAGTIVFVIIKNISNWNKNNHSPRVTVEATVLAKRGDVRYRRSSVHHGTASSTSYYVTFEIATSGDRVELPMTGTEYGLLIEGDYGKLTFQGTRFIAFDRM